MKLLAVSTAVIVGSTEQFVTEPSGVLGTIIIVGALVGALAMIWAKAVRPSIKFVKNVARAVDVLLELPELGLREWQDKVDGRLDALEGKPKDTKPGLGTPDPNKA